jgi:hypothetical protein
MVLRENPDADFPRQRRLGARKAEPVQSRIEQGNWTLQSGGHPPRQISRPSDNVETSAGYRSRYRLRKYVVEPVFGQIKQAKNFRQFLLRGIDKVKGEWAIICTAHNLAKLTA